MNVKADSLSSLGPPHSSHCADTLCSTNVSLATLWLKHTHALFGWSHSCNRENSQKLPWGFFRKSVADVVKDQIHS